MRLPNPGVSMIRTRRMVLAAGSYVSNWRDSSIMTVLRFCVAADDDADFCRWFLVEVVSVVSINDSKSLAHMVVLPSPDKPATMIFNEMMRGRRWRELISGADSTCDETADDDTDDDTNDDDDRDDGSSSEEVFRVVRAVTKSRSFFIPLFFVGTMEALPLLSCNPLSGDIPVTDDTTAFVQMRTTCTTKTALIIRFIALIDFID